MNRWGLIACCLAPVLTGLFLAPPALALAGGLVLNGQVSVPVALLLAPALLACLSAPGYVAAVVSVTRRTKVGPASGVWIVWSLRGAMLAAVGTAVAAIPTILGSVLALASLACARAALVSFQSIRRGG